mgnify:FL=1
MKSNHPSQKPAWYKRLREFQSSSWGRAVTQIATSVLPYLAILAVMIVGVVSEWPYWIVLASAVPAAGFLVRVFIIFHDCAHGSFVPSNRGNRIIGFLTGVLVFTPFEPWRLSHLGHHATAGNLDRRGVGDVVTMTFEEYQQASKMRRLGYRLYRNPLVMFLLGSFYTFVLLHRFLGLGGTPRERRSVIANDVALAVIIVGMTLAFGGPIWLLTVFPTIWIAGVAGIWLFYVQHQFDPSYWRRDEEWDEVAAAMEGSSYYKLPKILQWFSGNIGIHHIHHLRPRIPNYRLQRAYDAVEETHIDRPLTLWKSLGAIRYNLWSEMENRFMSFREAARRLKEDVTAAVRGSQQA